MLEIENLTKSLGQKVVVCKKLALSDRDKVALVGRNGCGKTTLLKLIAGDMEADTGTVRLNGMVAVVPQMEDGALAKQSGGEQTQQRIDAALGSCPDLLLADEPTSNLDIAGIQSLQARLCAFRGGLLLVSHDRDLLEAVCTKVFDIETGMLYGCGYADYRAQKNLEAETHQARYEAYAAKRSRLEKVAAKKKARSATIRTTPKRMGNSEARLHKMGGQNAKAKLDRAAQAAQTRMNQIKTVEKPYREKPLVFDLKSDAVYSPVLISVRRASKAFAGKRVLENCSFDVPNGKKTAIIGANGAGKTTLLDMIAAGEAGVETCARLKIGYFRQDLSMLCLEQTILENAMANSVYDACFVRTMLARLHFWRDGLDRKAGVLSGGERLKLALARILLSGFHLLMLDEPTNYLDAVSRSALESVLAAYPGAVLFTSHDRAFIKAVADRIVCLRGGRAQTFEGGWEDFNRITDA